jgi:surface antigen
MSGRIQRRCAPVFGLLLLGLLAGCAGNLPESMATAGVPPSAPPVASPDGIHPYQGELIQCVPYAREVSGIDILGDAWTWWDGANGRYARGHQPKFMAVLVLSRTQRLKLGHVAVVMDIVGPREIRVTQANFGSDYASRHIIYDAMPATDVSAANDWSAVRFWNYQLQAWGIVYPAYGFVYPERLDTVTAQGTPQ